VTGLLGSLPTRPGLARTAKLRAWAPPLTARQQSGQAVMEDLAALWVARPVTLTASPPARVVSMTLWSAVARPVMLTASLPARAVSWATASPLAPMGPPSTEPVVLGKEWFAAPRARPLPMTGLWARRIRPFPMGLTVPEHLLADPR
jgi:hypothetical protein